MANQTMAIGSQYDLDDEFKAAARLHQSTYRAEVLQVAFDEYGNRLREADAKALLNYYPKLNSREALRVRFPSSPNRRDSDMLRSEHIPFNLLAPLDTDRQTAIGVIRRAFGIECAGIDCVEIEYPRHSKELYLNDGTAFDTYIRTQTSNGTKCGIGIEVKYTERDYKIGKTESINVKNHQSLYWKTARASGCFPNPDDEVFGTDPLRQIWRNHLLGLSMVEHGDLNEFYSITLFPNGNKHFHDVLPKYISRLTDDTRSHVFGCTFEKFISSIGGTPEFEEWREWLERRYLVKS